MQTPAATPIDLASWPRRHSFAHFRRLDWPWYSVCVQVDVSGLLQRPHAPGERTLAYLHAALMAANAVPAMRQRIVDGLPVEFPWVSLSTTVLRADESLGFADLTYDTDFKRFSAQSLTKFAAVRSQPPTSLSPAEPAQHLIFSTTLPWLDFSSFNHARSFDRDDAIPRLAFGRIVRDGAAARMAVAIEVHHAFVDGLHVARFFDALQAGLS